jgi:UDP-N-acetylmuramate: L-alanyl-gamma-D-glutamyl-meso-diaminopimelate ligase
LVKSEVEVAFGNAVNVFNEPKALHHYLDNMDKKDKVFLMMSSGPWGGINLKDVFK